MRIYLVRIPHREGHSTQSSVLLASALAAVALMHSFAEVQRTLLASAGVRVKELRSEAAYYAANALSTQIRASALPCSGVTSAPTLPVSASLPACVGN